MIFFHECKTYQENLAQEDGGVFETVQRKINDLQHRKKLTASKMLKVYDRAGGIYILKLQGQGRNSRIIIQEYVEMYEETEVKIYFLRDYISQSEYEPRWRLRIEPEVGKGNYLNLYPLEPEELDTAREVYLQQIGDQKRSLSSLPTPMMDWLMDFTVDQDFCIYETRNWVAFSEKKMSGYEGDFYKLIRNIYQKGKDAGIERVRVQHADRNIWHAYDEQVYVIYEETDLKTGSDGREVILLHGGGFMQYFDRYADDRERAISFAPLEDVQQGQYSFDQISRSAYRAYPESALKDRNRWLEVQKQSAKSNLALSPEQIRLLENYRFPKFINGQAGSGKSEMLYYLFAEICFRKEAYEYDGQPIFLTENEELLERALYDTIDKLKNNQAYQGYNLDDEKLHEYFAPFQQFITEKLVDDPEKFPPSKAVNFSRFKQLYEDCALPGHIKKRYPAEIAWFVIYTFIKGYEAEKTELTPEEFGALPRRDRNVIDQETYEGVFNEVWKPFYKKYQEEQGFWDRLDLVKEVLNNYDQIPEEWKFAAIICDEAQDFTRVELQLLIKLSQYLDYDLKDLGQFPVTFAGDPFQTVNPTGFSLEKLKRLFTDELQRFSNLRLDHDFTEELHYNYRSGEPIVNLANLIQYVRYRFLDTTDLRNPQEAKQLGDFDPPESFSLSHWDTELQEKLKYGVFIIPCNDGEEEAYIAQSEQLKGRGFNVKSAARSKGSEYPVVVLFGFGDELLKEFEPGFFERLLDQETDFKQLTAGQQFKLSFYFNKLYVAITRAQEKLIIIDSPEGLTHFWQTLKSHPQMKAMDWDGVQAERAFSEGNVSDLGEPDFTTARKNADADREAGMLYADPKKMEDAARLYRQLGQPYEKQAAFCEAKALEFKGLFSQAGRQFEEIAFTEEASRCYWLGKEWDALLRVNEVMADNPKFEIRNFVAHVMAEHSFEIKSLLTHRANIVNAFKDRELRGRLEWENDFYSKLASQVIGESEKISIEQKVELAFVLASFRVEHAALHQTIAVLYFQADHFGKAVEYWDRLENYDATDYARAKFEVSKNMSEKIFYLEKYADAATLIQYYDQLDRDVEIDELAADIIQRAYWKTDDFANALQVNQRFDLPWPPLFREAIKGDPLRLRNFLSYLEDHLKAVPAEKRQKYLTTEFLGEVLILLKKEKVIRKYLNRYNSFGKKDLYDNLKDKREILDITTSLMNLIGLSNLPPDQFSGDYFDLVIFAGFLLRRNKTLSKDEQYLLYACALERTQPLLKELLPAFDSEDRFMLSDLNLEDPLRIQLEKRWIKIKFKMERREVKVPRDSDLNETQKNQILESFRDNVRNARTKILLFKYAKLSFRELADLPDLPSFDGIFKEMQEPAAKEEIKKAPPLESPVATVPVEAAGEDEQPAFAIMPGETSANGVPKSRKETSRPIETQEISSEKSILPDSDNLELKHQIELLEGRIKALEELLRAKDQLLVEKERSLSHLEMTITLLKQSDGGGKFGL